MTKLCDIDLYNLIQEYNAVNIDGVPQYEGIQSGSIDIRIGDKIIIEKRSGMVEMYIPPSGLIVQPGEFFLAETLESFNIPNGYGMDLKLKSSMARLGWNHSLAFWFDPGWVGVGTMEIKNIKQYAVLMIKPHQWFAQIFIEKLSGESQRPYKGRYHGARTVEQAKL